MLVSSVPAQHFQANPGVPSARLLYVAGKCSSLLTNWPELKEW